MGLKHGHDTFPSGRSPALEPFGEKFRRGGNNRGQLRIHTLGGWTARDVPWQFGEDDELRLMAGGQGTRPRRLIRAVNNLHNAWRRKMVASADAAGGCVRTPGRKKSFAGMNAGFQAFTTA